ncbi:unnamed protein product [Coregonus sp. 'balchen']|nr:unnamed protein product [Coregonus sp. 'balchen']
MFLLPPLQPARIPPNPTLQCPRGSLMRQQHLDVRPSRCVEPGGQGRASCQAAPVQPHVDGAQPSQPQGRGPKVTMSTT